MVSVIYPNPVKGRKLQLNSREKIDSWKVTDLNGRPVPVRQVKAQGDRYEISLDAATAPGLYILTYNLNGRLVQNKFVLSE